MSVAISLRFAVAIVLDALALTVWDVGTRPPGVLAADVARSLRSPRAAARGVVRFAAGFGLLVLAALVARPAVADATAFTAIETGMIVAALIVEALVGPDLRGRSGRGSRER